MHCTAFTRVSHKAQATFHFFLHLMAKKTIKPSAAAPKKAMKTKRSTKKMEKKKKKQTMKKVRGKFAYEPDKDWSLIGGTRLQ